MTATETAARLYKVLEKDTSAKVLLLGEKFTQSKNTSNFYSQNLQ